LAILQKKYGLSIEINKMDKEIKEFEKELIQTAEQLEETQKPGPKQQSYIG
jgi:predicted ATP-grasp superfamily ATP-dependent carboligase